MQSQRSRPLWRKRLEMSSGYVKNLVGYELGQASKAVKEKMKDAGEAVVNVDVEGATRQSQQARSRIWSLCLKQPKRKWQQLRAVQKQG